jgi:shikimate kinase
MQHNHIFLTGFMGAGKSTVGLLLADKLGADFIDTDQLIMQRHAMSISSIFAHYGEAYFRASETAVLQELKARADAEADIVSTGGGIVEREENRTLMHLCGTVVYLHASWDTLRRRLSDVSDRPLARGAAEQKLHQLWQRRLPLYASADLRIDTDGLKPQAVAEQILLHL